MKDSKEENNSNMEMERDVKEEDKQSYASTTSNTYNNMFQVSYDFFEEVVRVILRCLGFEDFFTSQPSSSSTPAAVTTPTDAHADAAATMTTTTTTTTITDETTIIESGGVEEESFLPQTPDIGVADGDGGEDDSGAVADSGEESCPPSTIGETGGGNGGDGSGAVVANPPGADPTPVQAEARIASAAIKKPPRPVISTGRGGQIH